MKHVIAILFSVFSAINLFGQNIGALEISDKNVKPWLPKLQLEYEGFYKFGESESESDLKLFFADSLIIGQVMQGYWEEGTGFWKWKYKNLTNIKIDKEGNFSSDQHSGQFVIYTDSTGVYKGLRIDNPWTGWLDKNRYEIGIELNIKPRIFSGKYTQASFRHLSTDELKKMSKKELKIMRNEIFARYGFKFNSGGEMDLYFKQEKWYQPQHENVTEFLTQLELHNIKLIKEIETKK